MYTVRLHQNIILKIKLNKELKKKKLNLLQI